MRQHLSDPFWRVTATEPINILRIALRMAAGLVIMIAIWISVRIFLMIAKIAKNGSMLFKYYKSTNFCKKKCKDCTNFFYF